MGRDLPETDYLDALKLDIAQELCFVQGRELRSIFFGGGTPSLMSGTFYQQLIAHIRAHIPFAVDIEITLEANPGTTDAQRFEGYRKAGINRLSIGVQSFHEAQLQALGRIHSGAQAHQAVAEAKRAGFDDFNLDLMHGLPGQDVASALADIETALSLSPTHLSWYQLTIEQNTEFYSKPPALPVDETLWDIQEKGADLLTVSGFKQYEVSAFCRPNKQARHNLNYWQFGDYIGIGAGAHAKVSLAKGEHGLELLRYRKSRMPKDYLKPRINFRVGEEIVGKKDIPFEFMMNALRLKDGVSEALFTERTGQPLSILSPQLEQLRADGLLDASRLKLSERGFMFLNSALEAWLTE